MTGLLNQIEAGIRRVGWGEVARLSGLRRENLHRAFGAKTNSPNLRTIQAVLPHIGLELTVREIEK